MPASNRVIGFIGLGIMGRPMALNLVNAGYPLAVYARRPEASRPLADHGANVYPTPAGVAAHADVIITMVSDTPDVEAVILGDQGIASGAKHGCVVIDMSTISPAATRRFAEALASRQIDMLDAPVSGGEQGAIDGKLSIMVGGKTDVFERMLPVFECLGKNIVYVGPSGAGQVAKACNQILVAQTIAATGEALLLARAAGADPVRVREALLGGLAYSKILENHGQRMLDDNYTPGFKSKLHLKDMRIALEAAREAGVQIPGADRTLTYLDTLVEAGHGELDSAAIARMVWGRDSLD